MNWLPRFLRLLLGIPSHHEETEIPKIAREIDVAARDAARARIEMERRVAAIRAMVSSVQRPQE